MVYVYGCYCQKGNSGKMVVFNMSDNFCCIGFVFKMVLNFCLFVYDEEWLNNCINFQIGESQVVK